MFFLTVFLIKMPWNFVGKVFEVRFLKPVRRVTRLSSTFTTKRLSMVFLLLNYEDILPSVGVRRSGFVRN